jgi:hypothetical protein
MLINPYRLANFSFISGLFDQAGPIPMPSNVDLRLRSNEILLSPIAASWSLLVHGGEQRISHTDAAQCSYAG